MTCGSQYTPELRSRGYRMTPQRLTILHVLCHSGGHLSPGKVFELARRDLPGITEPTVYRTLEFLSGIGLVHPAHVGGGHLVYQISSRDHHHPHLICRACGDEVELDHGVLGAMYRKLEASTGYRLTESHKTFFGLCPECRRKTAREN
jgi:Fe2+ or Zn2+ uptake regulation protein